MKWNILLVEDDEISIFLSTRLLEKKKECSSLKVAKNGKDALDYLFNCRTQAQGCPDLILLDINMPIMDGFEFLRHYVDLDFFTKEKAQIVLLSSEPGRLNGVVKEGFIFSQIAKPLTIEKIDELFALLDKQEK